MKPLLLLPVAAVAAAAAPPSTADLADPFFGSDGGGNTVPGAQVPFGFASVSPDTIHGATSGYDGHSLIIGFSQTHVSGTGGGSKYGNFRITPALGDDGFVNLGFPRAEERASPGFYSVVIGRPGRQIRAELTAGRLTGFERFTFPASGDAELVLDATAAVPLGGGGPRATAARVEVEDARHFSGSASFTGGWNPAPYTLYFAAELSRPAARIGRWSAGQGWLRREPGPGASTGGDQRPSLANRLGVYAAFDTRVDRAVSVKIGLSFVSVDQARRSIEREQPGWDFDAAAARARAAWDEALGRIEVEGGSEADRSLFYSALYRSETMPHDLGGENVWWSSAEPHYEDFYTLWDTFRTLHPLLTLIAPERQRGMVRSLIDTWAHTGWLPDGRVAGANGMTQGGSNADVVLADAIVKDLGGFDREAALRAMLKDGEVESPDPQIEGRELGDYLKLGYMSLGSTRSASRTLEYAFDDYAIAMAARKLGHEDIAARYLARSRNWRNLWDAETRCIRPRYASGAWLENFDCDREYPDGTGAWWDAPYYEGSARQYSTFVPHDVAGLIARTGGRDGFVAWLDKLFDGGGYDAGNEPDMLAPWLYVHAGRPDRTAQRVRAILRRFYRPGRAGLPGNDDAGALSSWYVWSAMGLFPSPAQPFYYIGSPVFARTRIRLEGGRSFVMEAPDASPEAIYVVRATLNGRPLDRAWLKQEEVAAGGTLRLEMSSRPSDWGRNAPSPPQ
ncbi:MAG TPA: GH92 family glycosyl hydrolase [Allosphingosinicella sp.]|nr:GH92 family glycosyl hydrolase [Allosphingosinicella sp.]